MCRVSDTTRSDARCAGYSNQGSICLPGARPSVARSTPDALQGSTGRSCVRLTRGGFQARFWAASFSLGGLDAGQDYRHSWGKHRTALVQHSRHRRCIHSCKCARARSLVASHNRRFYNLGAGSESGDDECKKGGSQGSASSRFLAVHLVSGCQRNACVVPELDSQSLESEHIFRSAKASPCGGYNSPWPVAGAMLPMTVCNDRSEPRFFSSLASLALVVIAGGSLRLRPAALVLTVPVARRKRGAVSRS